MPDEKIMSRMRSIMRWVAGALFLGVFLALRPPAYAVNPDSILLAVTPGNITYGVQITSVSTEGYNFQTVNVGATTISTKAIGVKNIGNASEYFVLSISNTQPDGWTPINEGVPGYDQFLLMGRLVASGAGQPNDSTFDVNTDTVTAATPANGAGRYGQADHTAPNTSKDLYLRLTMPSTVETGSGQTMTITINGQAN